MIAGNRQVVLVGGAMRSGTTVFHRCLCTARNANPYISESWYLHDLMRTYRWNLDRYEVRYADQIGSVENYRTLIRHAFENYVMLVSVKHGDPEILFLKHPELTRHFPEIFELFPAMKFIVVVRDPRDVVASIRASSDKLSKNKVSTAISHQKTIEDCCNHYKLYHVDTFNGLDGFGKSLKVVRYEDYIRNTGSVFASIGEFTGAAFDLEKVGEVDTAAAVAINFDREKREADPAGGAFFPNFTRMRSATSGSGGSAIRCRARRLRRWSSNWRGSARPLRIVRRDTVAGS